MNMNKKIIKNRQQIQLEEKIINGIEKNSKMKAFRS